MESIVIKNFGPIKDVELNDIRPMTVLIGESGSGKSTIMKVLALFRWIYKMLNIRSFLKYSEVTKSPFRFRFDTLLKNIGLWKYLSPETVLEYRNGSCCLELNAKTKKLSGTNLLIPKEELSLEKISFISEKRTIIPDIHEHNATIRGQMFHLQETYEDYRVATDYVKSLDLLDLGVRFEVKKTSQGSKHVIVPANENVSFEIPLNAASSGTQNLVPLNVIVEYYSHHYDLVSSMNKAILSYVSRSDSLTKFQAVKDVGSLSAKRVHIFIEEPELSLYPSSQRSLLEFLVNHTISNSEKEAGYQVSLFMATHSPYIVNYLNVLINRPVDTKEGAFIRPSDLSVYRVCAGKLQNLMGSEDSSSRWFVNTMDMSDDIEKMYQEYLSLVETK